VIFGDIGSILDEIYPPLDITNPDVSIRNASAVDDSPVVSTGTNRDALNPKLPPPHARECRSAV